MFWGKQWQFSGFSQTREFAILGQLRLATPWKSGLFFSSGRQMRQCGEKHTLFLQKYMLLRHAAGCHKLDCKGGHAHCPWTEACPEENRMAAAQISSDLFYSEAMSAGRWALFALLSCAVRLSGWHLGARCQHYRHINVSIFSLSISLTGSSPLWLMEVMWK